MSSTSMQEKAIILKILYDVDDVLWPCTQHVFGKLNIPIERETDFRIENNPELTPTERDAIIHEFQNADNFAEMNFYASARDILRPEELGAMVGIHSNAYSEAIAQHKLRQIPELLSKIRPEQLIVNVVTPQTNRKQISSDILAFVDDSPYNIRGSRAKFNFVPRRPWNDNSLMRKVMLKNGGEIIQDSATAPLDDIWTSDDYKYIIIVDDLVTINEMIYQLVLKLTNKEEQNGKI